MEYCFCYIFLFVTTGFSFFFFFYYDRRCIQNTSTCLMRSSLFWHISWNSQNLSLWSNTLTGLSHLFHAGECYFNPPTNSWDIGCPPVSDCRSPHSKEPNNSSYTKRKYGATDYNSLTGCLLLLDPWSLLFCLTSVTLKDNQFQLCVQLPWSRVKD